MTRANFSPGHRDLDKPLVEVDAAAPRRVRAGQRLLGIGLWTFIWLVVVANALLLLMFLIVIFTND